MAKKLKANDVVYVPCSKFVELETHHAALYRTTVVRVVGRSISVNLPKGVSSPLIGASCVHKSVAVLIIEIGDFKTEVATLDPLAKSVLQFCRLLLPADGDVRILKVRSLAELSIFWQANHSVYTHIILVGHGDKNVLPFPVEGNVTVPDLTAKLKVKRPSPKLFISLACKTGFQDFGGELSKQKFCKDFIGPFHSVHSAIASQFCQTFLTTHLLDGKSIMVAFKKARKSVPGGISFRLWQNGELS